FLTTDPALREPDIQLLFQGAPLAAGPYLTKPFVDGFACVVVLLRPESRGQVTLASSDPTAAPRIRQNFLSAPNDWAKLRAGVRMARTVSHRHQLEKYVAQELGGPDRKSTRLNSSHQI